MGLHADAIADRIPGKKRTMTVDRESIQIALAQKDWYTASMLMRRLLRGSSNPAIASYVLKSVAALEDPPSSTHLRIAFLRSFTLEPAIPLLKASAALYGIQLTVQVGEFNAYPQEILDPGSTLYRFNPQVVVLAVQTLDLAPDLWYRFSALSTQDVHD